MENFTPVSALVGGVLIGISASILLWSNGRIAGVSGILGGLLGPGRDEAAWRITFLVGLVAGAVLHRIATADAVWPSIVTPLPALAVAGVLVGYGTSLGNGCTSGHGVCGIARLSPRSILATVTFMATGAATVFVVRHVIGG